MSDQPPYPPPPAYPPPPSEPPAAPPAYPSPPEAAPAAYPAPGYYGAPQYGYPPPPSRHRASRGNLVMIITAIVVIVVLLVGVVGYVIAGYAYASSRISDATGAIDTVNAQRNYVNTTFDLLIQQVTSLGTTTDSKIGKSGGDQMVSTSQTLGTSVAGGDHVLATARQRLNDQQWLTVFSQSRIKAEDERVDHARIAVATVRSAAGEYARLGQFFQIYFTALIDFDTLSAAFKNSDFVGASTADVAMQADIKKAQQASTSAPGLPSEFYDFLTAFLALAVDLGKELNATSRSAFDAASTQVEADLTKLSAIDLSGTPAKITASYKHFRDDFNAEMDLATA
jgi:hypothetical protein